MESGRAVAPIALEVIHNRRSLCKAGMRGHPGVLTAILHWASRGRRHEIELAIAGKDLATSEELTWARRALEVGDEIVIRVVESAKVTRPELRRKPPAKEFVEKLEKAYLRRTAKKYGYKLVNS